MARRQATLSLTGPSLKTQQTGIDHRWKKGIQWMDAADECAGMACSSFRKHSRHTKKSPVGRVVWTDIHCHSLTQ